MKKKNRHFPANGVWWVGDDLWCAGCRKYRPKDEFPYYPNSQRLMSSVRKGYGTYCFECSREKSRLSRQKKRQKELRRLKREENQKKSLVKKNNNKTFAIFSGFEVIGDITVEGVKFTVVKYDDRREL